MNTPESIWVGTAGWSVPKDYAGAFPSGVSHLERYAQVFNAVEINSSFHRPHRVATYARWADSVPEQFRFAVKVPKTITHQNKLRGTTALLDRFLSEVRGLGGKLGPLLVQLPPGLTFEADISEVFLRDLRARAAGGIVCEPRHPSWFAPEIEALLGELRIGRVAADPAPVAEAEQSGGWRGLTYYRLHGSPRMYFSSYSDEDTHAITKLLARRAAEGGECWCVFDNTGAGAAVPNALTARAFVTTDLRETGGSR